MRIYITRHGETQWNRLNKLQGSKNSPLTARGIEDGRELGLYLEDVDLDKIYSSPLERAYETSLIIRGERPIDIQVLDGLREMSFGVFEGKSKEEINEKYSKTYYNYWHRPQDYQPILGETYEEFLKRVWSAFLKVAESKEERVLVVSHGVVIRAIMNLIHKRPLEEITKIPIVEGGSLTIIDYIGGEFKIIEFNKTSHKKN